MTTNRAIGGGRRARRGAAALATVTLLLGPGTDAPAQVPERGAGGNDGGGADRQPVIEPIRRRGSEPISPGQPTVRDAIPGLGGEDVHAPTGRLVREGAFISRRPGVLLQAPTGEWIMAFASTEGDQQRSELPPMVLLPCRTLEKIEATLEQQPSGDREAEDGPRDRLRTPVPIELTGEVLVYRHRNYLRPTLYRFIEPGRGEPEAESSTQAEHEDTTPQPSENGRQGDGEDGAPDSEPETRSGDAQAEGPASPEEDPRVTGLIEKLESRELEPIPQPATSNRDEESRQTDTPAPDETEAGDETAQEDEARSERGAGSPLLENGRTIIRVRGHLTRLGGGNWAFSPGGDPDSPGRGPMAMLPSRALEHAEGLIERDDSNPPVIVSGRIYVYNDARYLLARSVMRATPSDVSPRQ